MVRFCGCLFAEPEKQSSVEIPTHTASSSAKRSSNTPTVDGHLVQTSDASMLVKVDGKLLQAMPKKFGNIEERYAYCCLIAKTYADVGRIQEAKTQFINAMNADQNKHDLQYHADQNAIANGVLAAFLRAKSSLELSDAMKKINLSKNPESHLDASKQNDANWREKLRGSMSDSLASSLSSPAIVRNGAHEEKEVEVAEIKTFKL